MKEVPIWQKLSITVEEAAAYSGIGLKVDCKKNLIKRAKFEHYLLTHEAI